MAFVLLALASILFAPGPQVVHARFASINFSTVEQCGNFTVRFSGGRMPAALPLSLTVVPFNLTPISIGIANSAWDNTTLQGAAFTFLPFPAGTEFVASLDDANGETAALVSDVIQIQQSDNATCVATASNSTSRRYTVDQSISQCEDFKVTYNASVTPVFPTIRAFLPKSSSILVNQSTAASTAGNVSYTMDVARGQQAVLILSDDSGFMESTNLLTVGGDTSSPTGCLPAKNQTKPDSDQGQSNDQSATKRSLSKAAIIAIALVCFGTIGGLIFAMVWFVCKERRRVRQKRQEDIEDSFLIVSNKRGDNRRADGEKTFSQASQDIQSAPPMTVTYFSSSAVPTPRPPPLTLQRPAGRISRVDRGSGYNRRSSGFVKDPLYTDDNLDLMEPTSASYTPALKGNSRPSITLSQIPVPLLSPSPTDSGLSPFPSLVVQRMGAPQSPTDTLSSDEIEHILDMATMYSGPMSPMASIRSGLYRDSTTSGFVVRSDRADETASIGSSSTRRMDAFLQPSPVPTPSRSMMSTSPTSLLTPNTARNPPHAHIPSSPVPSPLTSPTGSHFAPV
ncbi:hypothetical protein BC835DRAFT_1416054 [Cytidiella melzeri]|nr:hypothetical protein BC835DRAFT_1416054 [Cytidiella melzeri]